MKLTDEQVTEVLAEIRAITASLKAFRYKWKPIMGDDGPEEVIPPERLEEVVDAIDELQEEFAHE